MYRQIAESLKLKVEQESKNDVVILYGARQVGKTTLLRNLFTNATYINLETGNFLDVFNERNPNKIKEVFKREGSLEKLIVLDEFQRLSDPGLVAKVIHDELPEYKLIITGSSSLELAYKASESLAGRKSIYTLFPLSLKEKLIQTFGELNQANQDDYKSEILQSMRYGMYPDLLNTADKEFYLREYVDSVMLKDVFYLNLVRNSKNLRSLLTLLAYQIGNLVNITDLADRVGVSRQTIMDYLEILKGIFIIYTLPPFRKKRRDEIGKTEKVFFYDLGIRNAVVNDFSPVEYRRDYGAIFENFTINEILKQNAYQRLRYDMYHWRTKGGSEVDLILSKDNNEKAFEIKTRKGIVASAFRNTYPEANTSVITLENISNVLLAEEF